MRRHPSQDIVDVAGRPVHLLRAEGSSPQILWFLHGLGCWSGTWSAAFDHSSVAGSSIYVPDLPGFGRTPPLKDSSLSSFASLLERLIEQESRGREAIVIAHSLGGAVATVLAEREPAWLRGLINVEGNLTAANTVVGRMAAEADDFSAWMHAFMDDLYRHGADDYLPLRHVYAGFLLSDPTTFRAVAVDAYRQATTDPSTGARFAALPQPCAYFRGTDFPDEAARFLEERHIPVEVFDGSGHFPMLDAAGAFYERLSEWVASTLSA